MGTIINRTIIFYAKGIFTVCQGFMGQVDKCLIGKIRNSFKMRIFYSKWQGLKYDLMPYSNNSSK